MGLFQVGKVWWYEFEHLGHRYRKSTRQKSKTKAVQVETNARIEAMQGALPTRLRKAPLLAAVAEEFLTELRGANEAGNLPKNTLRHYENGWKQIADTELSRMPINRIARGDVASIRFRGREFAQRACQQVVGRILNWAAEEKGYLTAVPRIKRTKVYGREVRITSAMEESLLAHMEADVRDVFLIMLDCGMRPEEVLRMKWEHVHWERDQYFNTHGKTKESRRFVPMPDRMRMLLLSRKNNGSQWVFPARGFNPALRERAKDMFAKGASIRAVSVALEIAWPLAKSIKEGRTARSDDDHRMSVAKQWEAARAAAGLDASVVLYCARHEFATTFLEHGGDIATLMKILGHTSLATTQKYLHPGIAGANELLNKRNNRRGLKIVRSA